jgi:serine/threonine protein kinase
MKERRSQKQSQRQSKKSVHFPETAIALQIPNNEDQKRSLESGEIPPEQVKQIQHDEIISSFAIGDTIRLPKNALRDPVDFVILKKIGSGTYGEVYEVQPKDKSKLPSYFPHHKQKNITYALKRMKSLEKTKAFEYEQMIMNAIASAYPNYQPPCAPHILCYFDISQDKEGRFYFLSEKMDGDVFHLLSDLKTNKQAMSLAKSVYKQTIAGLKELKELGLLHRDLKPENLLYHIPVGPSGRKRNSEIQIKLGDFGLSCIPKSEKLKCGFKVTGTPGYIDPIVLTEVWNPELDPNEKYKLHQMDELWDETNDIYSLAIILFEILFGQYLNEMDLEAITMKDADVVYYMYKDVHEKNKTKIEEEMKKYKDLGKEKSEEYRILEFILKNSEPFEKKQTIQEVLGK